MIGFPTYIAEIIGGVMYEQVLEDIHAEAKRLSNLQRTTIDSLQSLKDSSGNSIRPGDPIAPDDRSISDIDALVSSLVKFSEGFRSDKNWAFTPRSWITGFREAIKNTANSFENLKNNIEAISNQHGGVATIDLVNLTVTTKNNTNIDLRKLLSSISLNVDKAFESYFQLRQATSAPRLSEFTDLFSFFSTRRDELDSLSKELSSIEKKGREILQTLTDANSTAKSSQEQVTKFREEAERDRKIASESANDSTQRLEAIKAVQKSAEELSAAVNSYQGTFTQFQTQLDVRNKTYESQRTAFEQLKNDLDAKEKEIARLTRQAEDMLKGATNAGLAASFSQKQQDTGKELRRARLVYYLSIGLLVFLTLPIFLYSFPREFLSEIWKLLFHSELPSILVSQTPKTPEEHAVNLIGRAVFLIPGFLFVRFASARHAQLFRLREDYTYKYSIAASVEGFMKQAKTYADEIAASSYFELTYNPADKMDHKSDDARLPNPIWEKFLTKIEGIPKRKGADKVTPAS